jgi:WD40 repeat protein
VRPTLDVGDVPHRILARGRRLIMGSAFGDSAYFLPSVRPDRVWVVDVSPFSGEVRAVREVTVDGVTVAPAAVPPRGRHPLAAAGGGLLLATRSGLDVWDPHTGRIVRHLIVDPGTLGPTDGPLVTSCTEPQCHALALTDSRTGASRTIRAPSGFTFEPWSAAFSPSGDLLGIPVRVVADGPRQLALVDVASGRVAVVPRSSVSPGYTLVAWSASGDDVFLTGGGAYATPRVLVGYRLRGPAAQTINVRVGNFYDVAAI